MKRKEARVFKAKDYFELYDYINAKVVGDRINKIYDDFENRICENCKHLKVEKIESRHAPKTINSYNCNNTHSFTFRTSLSLDDGCNKWEAK